MLAAMLLPANAQSTLDNQVDALEAQVIEWRRDFHENPELSNREFRTAGIVAEHLRSLGMDVKTEVAHTGVIGILKGAHPGQEVPGLYLFVGGKSLDVPSDVNPSHHTPDFYIDESGMKLGLKAYLNLTLDYMEAATRQ